MSSTSKKILKQVSMFNSELKEIAIIGPRRALSTQRPPPSAEPSDLLVIQLVLFENPVTNGLGLKMQFSW